MAYLHAIGPDADNLVTLESLGIKVPESDFSIDTGEALLMSKKVKSVGSPRESWHWNFLKRSKRDALKVYCPGKSAEVVIVTIDNEGQYKMYEALMVWPSREPQRADRMLDFTLNFLYLIDITSS